jgi:hypothetical protein
VYGAALLRLRERDFERVIHKDGISPAWELKYQDFEPYYTQAEKLYEFKTMTRIQTWRFITIMLTSLSLSPSMAHLLELPRRMKFDQQLWVKVTVFENVYRLFGSVGAVFEIGAILATVVLTFLVRKHYSVFYWTLGGVILLVLSFVSWILFVAPMNAEFAQWLTNPVPADWTRYRDQWEYAHAINAVIKLLGLSLLVLSALIEVPEKKTVDHP